MLKEFIEKLIDIKRPEKITADGREYVLRNEYEKVYLPLCSSHSIFTLTGLVDFIKADFDKLKNYMLMINGYEHVSVMSPFNIDMRRQTYIEATPPETNPGYSFGNYYPLETFRIWLMTWFEDNDDRDALLRFTAAITDTTAVKAGDDGFSQTVEARTGITKVEDVMLPNPVHLAPYRTFPEVPQPVSRFTFRMQSGVNDKQLPKAALFESDGGAWKSEAIQNIRKWFEAQKLAGVPIIA